MNKFSGADRISAELFQILKDDAVKMPHSLHQQIWKTQQWPQDWKRSVFIPIPKKGKKQQLEPDMEQRAGSKLGEKLRQGCILSLCLFNLYEEDIMRNAGLDEAQAEIKIAGRNISNLRYDGTRCHDLKFSEFKKDLYWVFSRIHPWS